MKTHPVILIALSLALFIGLYFLGYVEFSVVVLSPLLGVTVHIVLDVVAEVFSRQTSRRERPQETDRD